VNSLFGRYFAAVIGFGFVAVWTSAGFKAAVLCLLGSTVFFLGSVVTQRRRLNTLANRFGERSQTTAHGTHRRARPVRQTP